MKKAALAFSAALALGVATAQVAPSDQKLNYDPDKASDGKKIYTPFCAKCHGLNMAVTPGSAFFDLRNLKPEEKERYLKAMNEGIRAMPSWKDSIKPEEMELIWSYIMTNRRQ